MQFIFGDNTSKYTLLYFDDQPESAEKIQKLVRMSYTPDPNHQALGFIPFGVNNTRALFFKFRKDDKMKRNVYFLHGVYGDTDPEYFFGDGYLSGMFTGFLDQDQFDALRDQVLAGDENVRVPYSCDTALAQTDYQRIDIPPAALHEILTKLYQRKAVVLVMEDETFSNDRARLVLKKIFRYLTPSLRKICSYVTAVDETGDMNFMLRVIPRSMLRDKEAHIDLDHASATYSDKTAFPMIAAQLMGMSDEDREALFGNFEELYYGRDSLYKKQSFEKFYLAYTATEASEEIVRTCDEVLSDFLDHPKCTDTPVIPEFLGRMLAQKYTSEAVLDTLVDWSTAGIDRVEAFNSQYYDVLRKVFYLSDPQLSYFRRNFQAMYFRPYTAADVISLKKICNGIISGARAIPEPKPYELRLLKIAADIYQELKAVYDSYDALIAEAKTSAQRYITQSYLGTKVQEPGQVVRRTLGEVAPRLDALRERITDIESDVSGHILNDVVNPYNIECNRRDRQEQDRREQDDRQNIFNAYVQRLKQDKGDGRFGIQSPETGELPDLDILSGVDMDPARLDVADLCMVADDDRMRPMLAQEIADYILNVCAPRGEKDFSTCGNQNLQLAKHLQLSFMVTQRLCALKAVDDGVLYLAAYGPQAEAAVKYLLQMSELDTLDSRQLRRIKGTLPQILSARRKKDRLDHTTLRELDSKAAEVLADKKAGKSRRVIATIVRDMVSGREPILKRQRRTTTLVVTVILAVAVLAAGALVLLKLLDMGKPDATGTTTTAGQTDNTDRVTDATDDTGTTEDTDATEDTGTTDNTDTTENTEATDNTDTTEDTEATDNTDTTEDTGATDNTDTTEDTGATDNTDTTEDTGATDNTDTTENTEATDNADTTENTEATEDTDITQNPQDDAQSDA